MLLMIIVVALYTITSLNDKYAVSKAKYNGSQLTFMMAAGTVFFLSFLLPFADRKMTLHPMSLLFIILIALSKYLEFALSAKILIDMSLFELKAWLGLTIFMSYFTDVIFFDANISALHIVCIIISVMGLVLIARDGKKQVNYKKIALSLIFYLLSRYSYGLIMKSAESYISSTMTLYFALILLAIVMLPAAKPWCMAKESPEGVKGMVIVAACKLPNAFGLLGENAIAAQSLTNFAFISPMILIVIFFIDLICKTEKRSAAAIAGSISVILGILGFQVVGIL